MLIVRGQAQLIDAAATEDVPDAVTRKFWDWVVAETGHRPPEEFVAIRGIVKAALKAEWSRREIGWALMAIERGTYTNGRRPPITKQTVWAAAKAVRDGGAPTGPATRQNPGVEVVDELNREWRDETARLQAEAKEKAAAEPSDTDLGGEAATP